jgi:ankyrin repeat protein
MMRILPILLLTALGASSVVAQSDVRLADAAREGDFSAVRSLLASGAKVNTPQPDGSTALHWAAYHGDPDAVQLLIDAHANVNAVTELGATPLWLASSQGNTEPVALLLKAEANPGTALLSGETALMSATDRGSAEVVKALLAAGADPNAAESLGGQNALMWAVAENYVEIVGALLEHKANPNARTKAGFTPMLFAAQQGATASATLLLDAGAEINATSQKEGLTPLSLSIASGHVELPLLLIERGADPNVPDGRGYTALHYAADERGEVELVHALIARGANLNARITKDPPRANEGGYSLPGATPLFMAARIANLEAVRALLDAGADPLIATNKSTTPFAVAAGVGFPQDRDWYEDEKKDFLEIVKLLADRGADINASGEHGWTPLHGAAYKGLDEIVRFLVAKGAHLEVVDSFGQTPLTIAGALQTVELEDHFYQSPRIERRDTFDLLLSLGAKPLEQSSAHLVNTATLSQ